MLLAALGGGASAGEPEPGPTALFHEANIAYREGDYDRAAEGYLRALQAGGRDSAVYYDLGNTCYRLGERGEAILAWRRAEELSPRDPDIRANLQRARRQVVDRLEPPARAPAVLFWQRSLALSESWLLGFVALALGTWCGVGARWRRRRGAEDPLARTLRPASAGLALVGLLLVISTLVVWRARQQHPTAVVLDEQVTAHSTTGTGGVELFELHEGAEVRIHEREAHHVLVRLPDDRRGWLPAEALGEVDPAAPWPGTVVNREGGLEGPAEGPE